MLLCKAVRVRSFFVFFFKLHSACLRKTLPKICLTTRFFFLLPNQAVTVLVRGGMIQGQQSCINLWDTNSLDLRISAQCISHTAEEEVDEEVEAAEGWGAGVGVSCNRLLTRGQRPAPHHVVLACY